MCIVFGEVAIPCKDHACARLFQLVFEMDGAKMALDELR
jgi:hypothetical protein